MPSLQKGIKYLQCFLFILPHFLLSQVGIGTTEINNGVMLQIESTDKGILIPRIGLSSITDVTTVMGPLTNGTLIYNTTVNTTLDEGFYYWHTNKWVATTPASTTNIYNSDGTLQGDRSITAGANTLQLEGAAGRNALIIKRTNDEISQGISFRNSGNYYDASIFMDKASTANSGLVFASGGNYADQNSILSTMTLNNDRSIVFNDYGTGKHNGTVVNLLGVDASGNLVETTKTAAEANIYNSNGTLTSDRVIYSNDHLLTFRNSANRDFSIVPASPNDINAPFIFKTDNAFTLQVDSRDALAIDHNSHIRLGAYGQGNIMGSATYSLGVDVNGNIIESPSSLANSGLQYYKFDLPDFTDPPNITTIRTSETADSYGRFSGPFSLTGGSSTGTQSPQADFFVLKFTGYYVVNNAGQFNFSSSSDDGARIYVDGSLILDAWRNGGGNTGSGTVNLAKGKHRFEFWYYEYNGGQDFSFAWGSNPDGRSGTINTNNFTID